MKPVRFHPAAQIELAESARHYERQWPGLGRRFLEGVRAATRRIQASPSIYQRVEADLRRCYLERFPFGVVFREKADHIEIIAVMHLKRTPEYWKERV